MRAPKYGAAPPAAERPSWRRSVNRKQSNVMKFKWAQFSRRTSVGALALAGAIIAAASTRLAGAVLTTVPMQGGMLMPLVDYHADTDSATVSLAAITTVPQLTPLLVSNPKDGFSTADPWFDCLDPARQGLGFSRRYGFNLDALSDIPPLNREFWIRKLAGSPGLGFYDYSASATPKKWRPILGTAGTTNAVYWSGLMWHLGVTAPPGTNTLAASFEVFMVDTGTGREVPGSSSGSFELSWTTILDGRPALCVSCAHDGQVRLSWPAGATNWTLVKAYATRPAAWAEVTNAPVLGQAQQTVTLNAAEPLHLFRLRLNR